MARPKKIQTPAPAPKPKALPKFKGRPWDLPGMPMLVRRLALDGASRHHMTVVEWVERAIRNQARLEERDEVYPPGVVQQAQQLPAVYNPPMTNDSLVRIEHEPSPVQERQENLPAYIELLRMLHDTGAAPEATTDLAKALVKAAKARLKRAGEA